MSRSKRLLFATLPVVALAATGICPSAHAQRLSLAERVAKLEQQQGQGNAQANIELVNQINALQAQLQNLQGQIEELRHQVTELKDHGKDQYIDLDSRIGRLEGRNATPAAAAVATTTPTPQMQDVQLGSPGASSQTSAPPAVAPAVQAPAAALPEAAIANTALSTAPAPTAVNPEDAKMAYETAFSALKDGRYAESARAFQTFIAQYPNDELTPNAYYWLGESYYVTQNYPVSLDTFRKLLSQFPNSQKAPDALLKVGYCQYEMKQWPAAQATLNQVLAQYPNTTVANLAQGRLRALNIESQH